MAGEHPLWYYKNAIADFFCAEAGATITVYFAPVNYLSRT